MIFGRFLGILTDCLGSEANEDDINALSGPCVSTPPWPPLHKGGKLRLRAQQKRAVGNGFYPPPKKAAFLSAHSEGTLQCTRWRFGLVWAGGRECQNPLAHPWRDQTFHFAFSSLESRLAEGYVFSRRSARSNTCQVNDQY
jgi:hypothetical protein